jgi:hypothetical protein
MFPNVTCVSHVCTTYIPLIRGAPPPGNLHKCPTIHNHTPTQPNTPPRRAARRRGLNAAPHSRFPPRIGTPTPAIFHNPFPPTHRVGRLPDCLGSCVVYPLIQSPPRPRRRSISKSLAPAAPVAAPGSAPRRHPSDDDGPLSGRLRTLCRVRHALRPLRGRSAAPPCPARISF